MKIRLIASRCIKKIYDGLSNETKYAEYTPEELANEVEAMDNIQKEKMLDRSIYENDKHIQEVIHKMFRPNNAYTKFDFGNGRPRKSAILTTSSIDMAKRYYHAIKKNDSERKLVRKRIS